MKTAIIYTSSDSYAMLTAHSIYSLLSSNFLADKYKIILFSNKIKSNNKIEITRILKEKKTDFEIFELGQSLETIANKYKLPPIGGDYSTYLRLFINTLYPNLNKVLFIDSDTFIRGSIKELLEFDLKENVSAGAVDIGVYRANGNYEDKDILNQTKNYFNAGVLLVNFKVWREMNLDEKVLELFRKYPSKFWRNQEQSILNYLLHNFHVPFHLKFNFYSTVHLFNYEILSIKFNIKEFIKENEYNDAISNPIIIHFVAPYYFRPWYRNNVSPYSGEFQKSVSESNLKLNLQMSEPTNSKYFYKFFDKLNYKLLKRKWFRLYFLFQSIASGVFKKILIIFLGSR